MFVYLVKKIAIPGGVQLCSISWNPEQGWIACGGEGGLLKVLKLDSIHAEAGRDGKPRGLAASSNLSMNQTLEGHNGHVLCVRWNTIWRKLTTSDQNGLIIVWILHKGMWVEEMINNRNKSVVRDMQWNPDGSKICIVYEDGAVIVGSVDGNRLWGKELGAGLRLVQWSPDSRHIVFVTDDNDCFLYDSQGNRLRQVDLALLEVAEGEESEDIKVIALDWYDGSEGMPDPEAPCLAVATNTGKVQLSRSLEDEAPLVLDSLLKITQCRWSCNGTILALAGSSEDSATHTLVSFYDCWGIFIRSIRVPGSSITSLSWEGTGLRMALVVDAAIYFANIRADYKWACIGNTLIYAYDRPDRPETSVVFWNVRTDTRCTKYMRNIRSIRAAGDYVACFLSTGDTASSICLCNSIGIILDSRTLPFAVVHTAMTGTHLSAANDRTVYIWHYRQQTGLLPVAKNSGLEDLKAALAITSGPQMGKKLSGRERMLDIEDSSPVPAQTVDKFQVASEPAQDPLTALTMSDRYLLLGRDSGIIQSYGFPTLSPEEKRTSQGPITHLSLSCDSSRLAVVDLDSNLRVLEMQHGAGNDETIPEKTIGAGGLERKDVWDLRWAEDEPHALAIMEKTRLSVLLFQDDTDQSQLTEVNERRPPPKPPQLAGEPILCSGYLGIFKDLEVRAYLLDDVLASPEKPDRGSVTMIVETKLLKEAREVIAQKGPEEGFRALEQRPHHPRLWRLLAELSLEKLDFGTAEKAFVRYEDYQGIHFVKRLRMLGDRMKQRAEIAVYFGRVDEAEAIYREIDRRDLARQVRERVGDYSRVVQLVQNGGAGNDQQLLHAWSKIGDYYADRFRWARAAYFYGHARTHEKERLALCYFRMEDYASLEKLTDLLDQGADRRFLLQLGGMLQAVGMCDAAARCYLKAGEAKQGIDCCVLLNHWSRAVEIAEQHGFVQIEGLLTRQVHMYLEAQDDMKAIELYRKADRATDAAQLLSKLAEDLGRRQANPLRAKKLQVLAALEVERFRKRVLDNSLPSMASSSKGPSAATIAQTTAQTLDNLMTVDRESGTTGGRRAKVLDSAWRGAAAYHYQLLAHRYLYEGAMDAAMKAAIRLAEFEDVLDPVEVYSLLALAAFQNRYYGICSRALIKLETNPSLQLPEHQEEANAIQNLAVTIFTQHRPYDPAALPQEYIRCLESGTAYHACTVTGRAVLNSRSHLCRTCRHYAIEAELRSYRNCPLCHSSLL